MGSLTLKIETIAIGDELLTGKISDSNSTFVADQLFKLGLRLSRQTVIADDEQEIQKELMAASERADFVVVFGGLGPTSDDKTAEAIAKLLKCEIVEHVPSRDKLIKFYTERGRQITPQGLKQALHPANCPAILNTVGMAPGFSGTLGRSTFYCLPGVPSEMKVMFRDSILPAVKARAESLGAPKQILSHVWKCIGIWESELQRVMDPIEVLLGDRAFLGYRTRFPENHLTLYVWGDNAESRDFFKSTREKISEILKKWCYTQQDKELEVLIAEKALQSGKKIAFAESCTGGLTAQRLTRVAGASEWLWGGYITYQRAAKDQMLQVKVDSDEATVGAECTLHLAERAKAVSGAAIAAAITGVLGPTGGTEVNPVGTIYLCVLAEGKPPRQHKITITVRSREEAQWGASTYLLGLLWDSLK